MPHFICVTCGVQYAESPSPPARCTICTEERQFVPESGQSWTTLDAMRSRYRNSLRKYEVGLWGIGTEPTFAIGQRALFLKARGGNVLWDCTSLVDDATIDVIQALGGVQALAISHPHFYGSMVEWSRALGGPPVHLHAADREWVMRPDKCIRFWEGETLSLGQGLTLHRIGGHFPGGTILHWDDALGGKGALLSGDIVAVSPDRTTVSVMYSYPNLIPVSAAEIRRITAVLEPLGYERVYGAWWDRWIDSDGKTKVQRSLRRYFDRLSGQG